MLDCWHAEPKLRPTFTELSEKISDILAEGARSQYLELSTVTGTEVTMKVGAPLSSRYEGLTLPSASRRGAVFIPDAAS